MKHKWQKPLIYLLVMISCIMSVGCTRKEQATQAIATQPIYFFDATKGTLFAEGVAPAFMQIENEDEQIKYILEALSAGPKITTLPNVVEMPIDSVHHDKTTIHIDFDEKYNKLNPTNRIAVRAMLVYSLCALDFIEGVSFSVEGEPMLGSNGKEVGIVRVNDIITDVLDPNQATSKPVVTLYFADETGKHLKEEQRRIELTGNVSQEKAIIEELIKGPQTQGLVATVPPDTVIKEVTVKNGICQVDLSFDLKSKFFTTDQSKRIMIYSIVNSLTESDKINKVAFLVDGKKDIEFTKDIDLRETFVRNERMIEKVEESD